MNPLKKIYYHVASLLPTSLFSSGGPNRILLPYHHLVNNNSIPHIAHLYNYKNEKKFIGDLECLLKNFSIIHPDELFACIEANKPIPKGSFLLSFDDGLCEVYHTIAPILKSKGIPAIFFINPAFIDNKEMFYRCKISLLIEELKIQPSQNKTFSSILKCNTEIEEIKIALKKINQNNASLLDDIAHAINYSFNNYLQENKPFLTTAQVIELHQQGFTIGAHSINHPYYKLLSKEDQIAQTLNSCMAVKEITGQQICHFSFPHSDAAISLSVIQEINKQNKGLLFGIQNQKQELHNNILHRFNAERPEIDFMKLIKGQLFLNRMQKVFGKNTVVRK